MSTSNPAPAASKGGGGGKRDGGRYSQTLHLPQTDFPMRAGLVENEPASLRRWEAGDVYGRLRARGPGQPKGRFIFHDGPPYANGSIHLGHLLNRCLKDFVVRTREMAGYDCPFVPGWDCHGLPIEHKVMTELVESGRLNALDGLGEDARRLAIRRECEAYARKFQALQAGQIQRLLCGGDYAHVYMTMHRAYEGAVLETLAGLVERGLVFRALKPVHWSIANETALAEAELEYEDRDDPSVYVDFEAADGVAVYDAFGLTGEFTTEGTEEEEGGEGDDASSAPRPGQRPLTRPSFMIWTTTPWTLPANMAIAVHPRFEYALVWMDGTVTVLAAEAVERVAKTVKADRVVVLATTMGDRLLGLRYRHPMREAPVALDGADLSRVWTIVGAEYVTLEDGTGLVHTAPGHGAEDFHTGVREGIPTYCPVLENGTYDGTVPDWLRGLDVFKANPLIVKRLTDSGHMVFHHEFRHSYPHDWRSKTPVIFRATEQWFIGVDRPLKGADGMLRNAALRAVEPGGVRFVPEWGRNRMRGMLESRPDWCISRQRSWGLPIPAFFSAQGECLMTAASVRAVARLVRERGSDVWFEAGPEDLLAYYDAAADPDCPPSLAEARGQFRASLTKSRDILDVWFESGSSWNAVMRERSDGEDFPVDLYLEGSDQHRGWFQASLLPSLAITGRPPFKTLLTHGFIVDIDGHKLSKSKGHTIEAMFEKYGADVLRWWVAAAPYEGDVKADDTLFEFASDSYRKVRNTLRFMLSNVGGDASSAGDPGEMPARSIDAWVLGEYNRVAAEVERSYLEYDFKAAQQALFTFCYETLSAVYLAAVKDRLYCDAADSARRQRTLRTVRALADGLCRLLAPILCHTADEAFRTLRGASADDAETCVHVERFIMSFDAAPDPGWARVMEVREQGLAALERAKADGIKNPLDAGLVLPDPEGVLAGFDPVDLADVCGVSLAELDPNGGEVRVRDLRETYARCERSRRRGPDVRERSDGGVLSDRDAAVIGVR
ncbi:MAG: isoleucine--tRNA ligase [Phycisphaeraceae bacterium]|nr:isoleucine--tRNA ligase [Phycisphaeraceae bacterium]